MAFLSYSETFNSSSIKKHEKWHFPVKYHFFLIFFVLHCAASDFKSSTTETCAEKDKKSNDCFEKIFKYCIFNEISSDKPWEDFCKGDPILLLGVCTVFVPTCPTGTSTSSSGSG
ncbi:hypothetical protein CH375_17080 [Leptospira ellisii]|uniref:Uncharacterized protein n=1 Tax=Leptospira ellisii TaxID=2023197 RepID=A0A2N0BHE9_9LEPT|nr:hypothetical protein CH379_10955 [Leptospira ellisii]PKA03426.1 hypothetical protein CH375_17080 [Leptospira ellisii]